MPLSDTSIRNAKPPTKPTKLFDGGGLYLYLRPNGTRTWRMKYRHRGNENTLAARASACLALGLIEQHEYEEITVIRKIRNEFGHTWSGTVFDAGRVADLCRNLPWLGPEEFAATGGPRSRFNFAVCILLADLLWRARLVSAEKRTLRAWPNKARGK